jgi:photosystem II stability/assembly factor-like uncharacterized protein
LLHRTPFRLLLLAVLAVGAAALVALPGASGEEAAPAREQQLADIERQIHELEKKLDDLKKADGGKAAAAPDGTLPPEWVKALTWRCLGPAAMGGRITDLAVYEADPSTYWVATASGGLLKTTNNGVTFEHQFDREATVSIGAVCVAPSDRNVVWVGTGENNPRNSASYGDGVYKSTDGGKTWKNMGLKGTFQTGKIVIHPTDPNTVYVGALGRLYGPSAERGLYKTSDGGQHWDRVFYVDDRTGVIDVVMSPANPDTLLVATWQRKRDEFDSHPGNEMPPAEGYDRYDPIQKWGPGSGLFKTTDGGKTFHKLTTGLPASNLGRIGLDYYRKDPNVVFAIIDCEKIGMGLPPVWLGIQAENVPGGVRATQVTPNSPAAKAGLKAGDVITAFDKKPVKDVESLTHDIEGRKAGDKVPLTFRRDKEAKDVEVAIETRPDPGQGGATPRVALGLEGEETEAGVRVARLAPDGAAAKAGVKADDVVLAIDKKPVKRGRDLLAALRDRKPGDKVTLQVQRGPAKTDFVVTLAERRGVPNPPPSNRPYSFWYGGQRENVQHQQGPDAAQYGGLYKSADGGETWTRLNSVNPRPMYFSRVRVDPSDARYLYVLGIELYRSHDGGQKFTADGGNGVHPDQHALWIDPKDGRHMIVGCDGGFYATYDRMEHWDYLNHTAIGQFYHVAVDTRKPYRVYGGLQDNGSWGGPSHSLHGPGPMNEDWIVVGGGDGFVCRVDQNDPDVVYWESQDGHIGRRNLRTGQVAMIRPREPEGAPPYRFNWNTPFILSSHNSRIFYSAGNYVFRSYEQGDNLRVISPEVTRTKRGSGSALAEAPRNADVLWVGTDDGNLWVTRDGGQKWTNVVDKVGLPGPRWVASIEPSRFAEGRAYVAFDAHRSDDDQPYIYVTEDFGQTWKSLRGGLPAGSTRVLREDVENPDLLYLGTEFAAWVSLNRGASWTKVNNNLPTVAVHEFAVHPTAGEVVAATHGRSLWVLDVTALRQMSAAALKAKAHLYRPNTAVHWRPEPPRGSMYGTGSRHFVGQNPAPGAQVFYALAKKADKISLKVLDYAGKTLQELPVKNEPGLQHVAWNLLRPREAPGGGQGGGPRGGFRPMERVPAGMYRVVLAVDGEEQAQPLRVEDDPNGPAPLIAVEDEDEEARERREAKEKVGRPAGRVDY